MTESNNELLAAAPAAQFQIATETLEKLVVQGDLSRLTSAERLMYYRARCEAAGLDYRTQPFEFLTLDGKLVLYARKNASDQLSAIHGARGTIISRETSDDIHTAIVRVSLRDGREMEDVGCVSLFDKYNKPLVGNALANAKMRAVTKARRRAILSICGLGMMDESELDTVPQAGKWQEPPPRTLDAIVEREAAKPPQIAPAASDAQAEPVAILKAQGLSVYLGRPFEDWRAETIGGANRNLQGLKWEDLLTSQDPGVLAAVRKGLEVAISRERETGQPTEARYQKLAVSWDEREQAELHAPAAEAI